MTRMSLSNPARERWIMTLEQMQNLRTLSHRLLERLTVVSGYGELALDVGSHLEMQEKLLRIVASAKIAKQEVLCSVAVLDSLVPVSDGE
jgi:hypothetical protein